MLITIDPPNPKQALFLTDTHKHVGFGGARGGGKSWAVRTKAKLLCLNYPGIRCLIVRRTYPELVNNHIQILRPELRDVARYNDKDKQFKFLNGSVLDFQYCAKDADLDRLQGVEYDILFIDEATMLSEFQMKALTACVRGANDFPKRIYYTMNPGGMGHNFVKRLFIDKEYEPDEDPSEYSFIQSLVTDNLALMQSDPDYIRQLEALPHKLREAWLHGNWDIYEGMFFEELVVRPPDPNEPDKFCHVIPAFEPPREWTYYRSFDFGYAKPFSCGWWAIDYDGRLYRIAELYGCTKEPNTGVKWTPDKIFSEIARVESEHPYLKGREILGVADPSIWDASRGESVAETAAKHGIIFTPGDNERIPGWMQVHYRLAFDEQGIPMMYVFDNCKAFIRTMPLLMYSETHPEDLDTDLEDHVADEVRYMCMARPIKPVKKEVIKRPAEDPLDMFTDKGRVRYGIV